MSAAGLILAAGLSSRFGADKLAADFRGRPVLQHVLDAAADAGLQPVVIVLAGARTSLDWRGARPVINPGPRRGLSSSLAVGLDALAEEAAGKRVLVLLGDQPLIAVEVIGRLVALPVEPARPVVVPRYADGRPGNPVLLEPAAWPIARMLTGDAGMSQLFEARPNLVRYLDVVGANPDIDTPADLAALEP
ncbi:MAG TPA: nucleotidyltransferase family protein [Candidatus Limnocylindrales bacterium]|nr:nucleotidyltransferase family protein [Candidatus Limnocylindrales bacterium]